MTTAELREHWNSRLTQVERLSLDYVLRGAASGSGSSPVTPGQAMEHAVGHVFARDSAVSEKRLLEESLRFGVGSVVPDDVKKELDGHGIVGASIDGRRVVTTEAVLSEEQAMVEFAVRGGDAVRH